MCATDFAKSHQAVWRRRIDWTLFGCGSHKTAPSTLMCSMCLTAAFAAALVVVE